MTRKTKQKSWKEPMNFLKQDFLSTWETILIK